MKHASTLFVGLDVHQETIEVVKLWLARIGRQLDSLSRYQPAVYPDWSPVAVYPEISPHDIPVPSLLMLFRDEP